MAQGFCNRDCKQVTNGQSRGRSYYCNVCKKWSKNQTPLIESEEMRATYKDGGYCAEFVIAFENPITTIEELRKSGKIDESVWNIDKVEFGQSAGYRKDKKVDIKVQDGKMSGTVKDSGKLLVVPLFTCRVWVSRKTPEIRNQKIVDTFVDRAKKFAPKYPKISYKKHKEGHLYELGLPDLQLGRLVSEQETGMPVTPQSQLEIASKVIERLIAYSSLFDISRVVFPIGNDFFNSNTAAMTTAHGTPQSDDVRWHTTFSLGAQFLVDTIDSLSSIAPVDVLVIPGNHDEERIWYMGEYLQAWYHKNPNVVIDNRPQKRKYYHFGKVLLGFTHGYSEKMTELGSLMAYEVPHLWSQSLHREWHLGDKHHKVDMILKTKELNNGVVVRILRSLAVPSVWEFDKGYVGALRAGEVFIWHPQNGICGQFTESMAK